MTNILPFQRPQETTSFAVNNTVKSLYPIDKKPHRLVSRVAKVKEAARLANAVRDIYNLRIVPKEILEEVSFEDEEMLYANLSAAIQLLLRFAKEMTEHDHPQADRIQELNRGLFEALLEGRQHTQFR